MYPEAIQSKVLEEHGDLYHRHDGGFPALNIEGGVISLGSVVRAPFGVASLVDGGGFVPLEDWLAGVDA